MIGYPKIDTLFTRNDKFKVTDELRNPAFGLINEWLLTEKVDGTNIRLDFRVARIDHLGTSEEKKGYLGTVGGRTDNAQLNASLISVLQATIDRIQPEVEETMEFHDLHSYTLYGEGYGAGIQKGGGLYRPDKSFILFDILINDKTWLSWDQVEKAAKTYEIDVVPIIDVIGDVGEWEQKDQLKDEVLAFYSTISQEEKLAEGYVARTRVPLYDQRGHRLMWKIKATDY